MKDIPQELQETYNHMKDQAVGIAAAAAYATMTDRVPQAEIISKTLHKLLHAMTYDSEVTFGSNKITMSNANDVAYRLASEVAAIQKVYSEWIMDDTKNDS